jgi:hypothetical protein
LVLSSYISTGLPAEAIEWHGVHLSWLSVGPSAFYLSPGGNALAAEFSFTVALDCGHLLLATTGTDFTTGAATCVADGDEIDAVVSVVSASAPAPSVTVTVQAEATPSCSNSRVAFEMTNATGTYSHRYGLDPSEIMVTTNRYVVVLHPADVNGLPIRRSTVRSQMSVVWDGTPIPLKFDASTFSAEIPLTLRSAPGSYKLVVRLNRGLAVQRASPSPVLVPCELLQAVVRVADVPNSSSTFEASSNGTAATISLRIIGADGISPISLAFGVVGAAILSCTGTVLALFCCRRAGLGNAVGALTSGHHKHTARVQPAQWSEPQAGKGEGAAEGAADGASPDSVDSRASTEPKTEGDAQDDGPHIVIDHCAHSTQGTHVTQRLGLHITAQSDLSKETDYLRGYAADSCARALQAQIDQDAATRAIMSSPPPPPPPPHPHPTAHAVDLDNVMLSGLPGIESPESRPVMSLPPLEPMGGNPYDFSAIPLDGSQLSSNYDDSHSDSSPGSGRFAARTPADRYLAKEPSSRRQPPA